MGRNLLARELADRSLEQPLLFTQDREGPDQAGFQGSRHTIDAISLAPAAAQQRGTVQYASMSGGVKCRDWKRIAEGLQLGIPEADLDRITAVLDALEAAFRPLAASLPFEVEPAVIFSCETEGIP